MFLFRSLVSVVTLLLAVVLLVAVWYWWPQAINTTLDFNIQAIKAICGTLPVEYAAHTESAVRALNTERGMLVGEMMVIINMVRYILS